MLWLRGLFWTILGHDAKYEKFCGLLDLGGGALSGGGCGGERRARRWRKGEGENQRQVGVLLFSGLKTADSGFVSEL